MIKPAVWSPTYELCEVHRDALCVHTVNRNAADYRRRANRVDCDVALERRVRKLLSDRACRCWRLPHCSAGSLRAHRACCLDTRSSIRALFPSTLWIVPPHGLYGRRQVCNARQRTRRPIAFPRTRMIVIDECAGLREYVDYDSAIPLYPRWISASAAAALPRPQQAPIERSAPRIHAASISASFPARSCSEISRNWSSLANR